ncbi:MAG: hypothetical protein HZB55_11675 [Deltaproteobacteria bacterium]|nr:hypothetical protein [Deltaproteobacteria bacterium]
MPDDGRFQPAGGLPGLVYVPEPHGAKKHPCAECFECQWCPDSRCAACRGGCEEGCRRGRCKGPGAEEGPG